MKVVTSDPRLLEKVKNLGVLYKDMELVQGRYVKVKGEGAPPPIKPEEQAGWWSTHTVDLDVSSPYAAGAA